jgi:minimal PKS acyl carrier protein
VTETVASQMTVEDLVEILATSAGADDDMMIDGSSLEEPFLELGYDSLALLETAAAIKRRFGVEIADDEVGDLDTPRALLERVNRELGTR